MTNKNCKGKLAMHKIMSYIVKMLSNTISKMKIQCNIYLIVIELNLYVILNSGKKWHKFHQLISNLCQLSHRSFPVNEHFSRANDIIMRLILIYFTYRWMLLLFVTVLAIVHTFITIINIIISYFVVKMILLALSVVHFSKFQCDDILTKRKFDMNEVNAMNESECIYFKHIKQRQNRFDKIASINLCREKKHLVKQHFYSDEKFNLHNAAMFDVIPMKSVKNHFLCQPFLNKDFIKQYDSVVIVRMVQIVVSNDKSTVDEPLQQTENVTNNTSSITSNGMPANGDVRTDYNLSHANTTQSDAVENADAHPATTTKANIAKTVSGDNAEKNASQSTNISIQTVSTSKQNASNNKHTNVIMVKRSKTKEHSNGVTVPMFRSNSQMSVSSSATSKSNEKRSSHATTSRSVIIMNKLGQTKNGNKTEVPTKTNHLLRILNSPPKPINASTLPTFGSNLERTLSNTQIIDYQKSVKVQTTVANDASTPATKNENTVNVDQTKLRNLLSEQNGTKKLNNNLFICKTEGKVIRLTPLMGSNCFNNISTATIQPSISNEVRVLQDIQHKPVVDKKDSTSSKSPPPLTLAISTANTSIAKTSSSSLSHPVLDEIFTKFMNTKDTPKDSTVKDTDRKNGTTTSDVPVTVDDSTFKTNFYTIPSSHEIISTKPQTTTFLQCQGSLVKTDAINANISMSNTSNNVKSSTKTTSKQTNSAIFLKQIPKILHPQSKSDVCEILVTNENNLKILQKNDTTNSALNQIHIFPLIAPNSRNVAISSAQTRTNYVRPQVIITSTNATDGRIQNTEPDKRNLVDQLREFDMVMEQIKEGRNTNEPTDKLVLNNLNGILNQHITDSQTKSTGLPQKINVAIIKKSNPAKAMGAQKTVDLADTKRNTSTSVVVVSNANVATSKSSRLTIEPQQEVITAKSNTDSSIIQTTLENVTGVKINSANLKTVQSPSSNQNAAAKHPQKSQEDEHTVQRIYDILAQYAEQISSSPDLNNKPAPRRRSNLVSIQSSPIATSGIRMVSSKSSISSSSSTTVGSIISSSSNSNSSNESYQSVTMTESRKRSSSQQNDDHSGTDGIGTIDAITIQQPADKKRCISNIKLDANDFILTTVPSLSTYTSLPKSNSNDMLKPNNHIIITTTNAQQPYNTDAIPATGKKDQANELMLKNINTNLNNGSNKLKPLTIGVANTLAIDSTMKPPTQSSATILLPNVSMVVSGAEQNLQHGQTKITNTKTTTNEMARICGFTTGFPYKINIASPNKSRQTFKQCNIQSGQSYRNDSYILPMSILKYGKNQTVIGEQPKISQMIHSNVATVMIPSTANVQRDRDNNIKIVSNTEMKKDISKPKPIQFNITKKRENFATVPATSLQSSVGSTLLLRTLSGTNIGAIQSNTNKISNDGNDTICEQLNNSNDNSNNILPTFTPIKTHQSVVSPLVESIQLPSQIFQSNRGILILDSNKYATLLTTTTTIPTTTAPVLSDIKRDAGSVKSSDTINEPKVTAITTPTPTSAAINVQSKFGKIDMDVPICNAEHDFLLENGLNVDSPKCNDNATDETFDDLHQNGRIFTMKTLPESDNLTLFSCDFSKNSDDILHQNDNSDNDVIIDDAEEMIFHHNDKSSDNVVIIDKQKSDSLTLNSVSSEIRMSTRRSHSIIERELRLQKSLSEECQDLGVDEPSTNDLFPDVYF